MMIERRELVFKEVRADYLHNWSRVTKTSDEGSSKNQVQLV